MVADEQQRFPSPITVSEASELHILEAIASVEAPTGSRVLRHRLLQQGIDLSEATTSRWLTNLTDQGLLAKKGRQGRLLTASGRARLQGLQTRHDTWAGVNDLFQVYEALDPAHLLDLLHARRLIEPEIARLAALRASEEDVGRIVAAAEAREHAGPLPDRSCEPGSQSHQAILVAETDMAFHRAVAQGARSPALATTILLLRSAEPHFPIFVRVREYLGRRVLTEHQQIAEAIAQHDADLAQERMYRHLDGVLSDVERYAEGDAEHQPEPDATGSAVPHRTPRQERQSPMPAQLHRFAAKFPVKTTVFASVASRAAVREVVLAPSSAHVVRQGDIVQLCIHVRGERGRYATVREIALVEVREAGVLVVGDDVVVDSSERIGAVSGFDVSALPSQIAVIIDVPAGGHDAYSVQPGALVSFRG